MQSVEATRMQRRYASPLRCLLLWLSLFLLAPAVQAHEGHDLQREGVHSDLAQVFELSAVTLPCGGHGGALCSCGNICLSSPNLTKLPAVPQAPLFLPTPHRRSLPAIAGGPNAWTTRPIMAFAAPRAPPLPL